MKQIIIHAGFHKTATSSIQKTCAKNKDKLQELGFYYPLFNLDRRVIPNHSIPFYSLFSSNPDKYHVNVRWGAKTSEVNKKYEEQLNHILEQKYNKILISGEDISILSQLELNKIRKKIQSHAYDIRVIIFVRRPLSSVNSVIQQRIKDGSSIETEYGNYKTRINKIQKIKSVFPEAEFFSFRESCNHKYGPVGYFLEIIGVSKFSHLEFIKNNQSASDQAIRLISFINKEQPLFINGKISSVRKSGDTNKLLQIKGDKFQLNKNELTKFKNKISEENEFFLNKFGISFCDLQQDFVPDRTKNNWSSTQLKQLKIAISKIDENLKIIAYDYFKNIICLDKKQISSIFF